jgi:predicted RNase H-like HicB family nuclease
MAIAPRGRSSPPVARSKYNELNCLQLKHSVVKSMTTLFILSDYVNAGMVLATYDKLEDGTFSGRIPNCPGVIAFGSTLRNCEDELRSTFEDWILVGIKLGHSLPTLDGIDLNQEIVREPVDTL